MNTQDKKTKKKNVTVIPPPQPNVSSKTKEEPIKSTDPQEEMEGPISSIVQTIKEKIEENNQETKEEADRRRDENI